jgi:hypothetical protein
LSRVWQVRPRMAARGYQLIRGTRSSAHAANGFCLTAGTVRQSRDWEHSPAWRSSRKSVAAQGHEIVLGHSWKGGMNTSIFRFAPWAGPAYLALADAIERAILAGSVQAGDRLPPQPSFEVILSIRKPCPARRRRFELTDLIALGVRLKTSIRLSAL